MLQKDADMQMKETESGSRRRRSRRKRKEEGKQTQGLWFPRSHKKADDDRDGDDGLDKTTGAGVNVSMAVKKRRKLVRKWHRGKEEKERHKMIRGCGWMTAAVVVCRRISASANGILDSIMVAMTARRRQAVKVW
jgi:hypothetical protein